MGQNSFFSPQEKNKQENIIVEIANLFVMISEWLYLIINHIDTGCELINKRWNNIY